MADEKDDDIIPPGNGYPDTNDEDPPPQTEAGGAGNGNKGNGRDACAGDDDYVGYGHPPKRHRFKPGRSGNPKGRPRGARGMKSMLRKELGARVQVVENGKRRSMTKMEVLIKRLVEQGAKGDVRSITKLIELGEIAFGLDDETERAAKLTADEQAIIDGLLARQARARELKSRPPTGGEDEAGGDTNESAGE